MRYQSALCMVAGLMPLVVITALSSLTSGFVLFRDYISALGVGEYATVFNGSLIVAAVLVIPFVIYTYERYSYLIILFLATAASLAGVGLYPANSSLHQTIAAVFFLLAFTTIIVAGMRMRRRTSRSVSIALGIIGLAGLTFFSPFAETLLVYAIGLWVTGVGLFSKRLYEKG